MVCVDSGGRRTRLPKMLSMSHSVTGSGGPTRGARDAFFLCASESTRARFPDVSLILTGEFRSRTAIDNAL
ncbi:hypothetical protein VTI74DRAFT_1634 [Chaetomium olivicolor]